MLISLFPTVPFFNRLNVGRTLRVADIFSLFQRVSASPILVGCNAIGLRREARKMKEIMVMSILLLSSSGMVAAHQAWRQIASMAAAPPQGTSVLCSQHPLHSTSYYLILSDAHFCFTLFLYALLFNAPRLPSAPLPPLPPLPPLHLSSSAFNLPFSPSPHPISI